jgi:hypothetical protein
MQCDHICAQCGAPERGDWDEVLAARLATARVCHGCDYWIRRILKVEFESSGLPRTEEDWCAILARFAMRTATIPRTEAGIMDLAAEMAKSGFADKFAAADYGKRSAWIDMCERALRSELKIRLGESPL